MDILIESVENLSIKLQDLKSYCELNGRLPNDLLEILFSNFNYKNHNFNHITDDIINYIIFNSRETERIRYIYKDMECEIKTSNFLLDELYKYVNYTKEKNDEILVKKYKLINDFIVTREYEDYSLNNGIVYFFKQLRDTLSIEEVKNLLETDLFNKYKQWFNYSIDNVTDSDVINMAEKGRLILDKNTELHMRDNFINLYYIKNPLPNDLLYLYLTYVNSNTSEDLFSFPYCYLNNINFDYLIIEHLFLYSSVTNVNDTFDQLVTYILYYYNHSSPTPKYLCDQDNSEYYDDYDEINILLQYIDKYQLNISKLELQTLLINKLDYKCIINGVISKLSSL